VSDVEDARGLAFDELAQILIIGAGAAGLSAALAARERGADVIIIERDRIPSGSTALSAGLIPAANTSFQRERGVVDSPGAFARDIQVKAKGAADPTIVDLLATQAAETIEWLTQRYGFPFSLVDNFDYPGHSARRMHGLPSRSGSELIDRLRKAAEDVGVTILTEATARTLFAEASGAIRGVEFERPDGRSERIGCETLILSCNGYGGNREIVRSQIPEMSEALYFGHPGNRGDAVLWGQKLGAKIENMSGYQGHGSVAQPHGALITWATIMEGGFQVNRYGRRFSDESRGYSEQAAIVLSQPDGVAFNIFDERIADIARQFEDFRQAEKLGAIISANSIDSLSQKTGLPPGPLGDTIRAVDEMKRGETNDPFGRIFLGAAALASPFKAVRVTGALFHTQGGLAIDRNARVLRADGRAFGNIYAAGGAATGVSGPKADGYLSGNGLLTATVLGRLAGMHSAGVVKSPNTRAIRHIT
jgi:fumarate reductase flavoprotein subunit